MRKTLLLITGPTQSVGRTSDPLGGPAPNVVDYDCRSNIEKLADSAPFFDSVLFTWEGQPSPPGVNSIFLSDEGLLDGPTYSKNMYRQSFLIARGASYALQTGYDYVVRMRTDQFFDLKQLTDFDFAAAAAGKLVIFPLRIGAPWLSDFFFLGRANLIADFFAEHLTQGRLSDNVHEDLFRRWSVVNGISDSALFPRFGQPMTHAQIQIVHQIWAKSLHTIDVNCLDDFWWRGNPLKLDVETWSPTRYGRNTWAQKLIPEKFFQLLWTDWFAATNVTGPLAAQKATKWRGRKVVFILNKLLDTAFLRLISIMDKSRRNN